MLSFPEVHELSDEVRRVFDELDCRHTADARATGGIFTPPLDVIETQSSVEVMVDLAGVGPDGMRVLIKDGTADHRRREAPARCRAARGRRLPPRRARLRPVRARGAPARGRRRRPVPGPPARRRTARDRPANPRAARARHQGRHRRRGRAHSMNLLFVGDVVGHPGREVVKRALPAARPCPELDLVVANAENSAGGFGVTKETADALLQARRDVLTTGNHVWDKKEAFEYIGAEPRLLRPAELPGRRARTRRLVGTTARGERVARDQRDGPRATCRSSTTRSRPSRARWTASPREVAASSSSTSTPRPRRRRSRWAGTSTAARPPSSARTRTCRRPTSGSCPAAPRTSATSA